MAQYVLWKHENNSRIQFVRHTVKFVGRNRESVDIGGPAIHFSVLSSPL